MSFWKEIFGLHNSRQTGDESTRRYYAEKDNLGSRLETTNEAVMRWWTERQAQQKFEPFLMYIFDDESDARNALLDLDFIHIAEDSGKLICTETLLFGYYLSPRDTEKGKYEVMISGDDLNYEMWSTAKTKFSQYNGVLINEKQPEKRAVPTQESKKAIGKVTFVREDRQDGDGGIAVYRIYRAPNAEAAKAFLQENSVTKNLYYIVVETPEGNYGLDIKGIYKE